MNFSKVKKSKKNNNNLKKTKLITLSKKNKSKKSKKKKNRNYQHGGSILTPQDLIGSTVIINDNLKDFKGQEVILNDYNPGKESGKGTYTGRLKYFSAKKYFTDLPPLSPGDFEIKEQSFNTQKILGKHKVYVLWVVNCDSCKIASIPYCSNGGIKESYHYYHKINEIYSRLNKSLLLERSQELNIRFFCSILFRSQETAKLITKGIKDYNESLYQKIINKIMIMNYCQEIQFFKTNLSTIENHANFLNELIPSTLEIDSSRIMGIEKQLLEDNDNNNKSSVNISESIESPYMSPEIIDQKENQSKSTPKMEPSSIIRSQTNTQEGITQTGGGLFDFFTNIFKKNSVQSPLKSGKDDYRKWKDIVLPLLKPENLNVLVSHGKYIKRNVLNNNSSYTFFNANNMDGFLVEYSMNEGKVTDINYLDENLNKTSLVNDTSNINFKPTIKTELIWNKVTEGSSLSKEKKYEYSKCFLEGFLKKMSQ